VAFWANLAPQFHAVLRIIAAFMFLQAGMVKLFAIPIAMPGGGTATFMTQIWIGAVLEFVGGGLILIGLFTRPVAFILAGEMAVAYFQFHAPKGLFPAENGGMAAVFYCFLWLYYSASGAGIWSVDHWLHNRKH
jgi:putative oxidoreductase